MNSPAPLFNTTKFNDGAFNFTNYLTKVQADGFYIGLLYLPSNDGISQATRIMIPDASNSIQGINQIGFASMNYNGTIVTATGIQLNYLSGVIPGTASPTTALVLDASSNITGINSITSVNVNCTNLTLSGVLTSTDNTNSSAYNNGSIIISGGMGIAGNIYCNENIVGSGTLSTSGVVSFTNTSASSAYTNGALVVSGGVGIKGNIYTNASIVINGVLNGVTTLNSGNVATSNITSTGIAYLGTTTNGYGGICVGTSTDNRYGILGAFQNSATPAGNSLYWTLGTGISTYNEAEFTFYYAGSGSSSNRFSFGFYGQNNIICMLAGTGYVGFGGNTSPAKTVDITGTLQCSSVFTNTLTTDSTSISSGASILSGGLGVAKTITCTTLNATTIAVTTFSATNLSGTLITAAQPNITSLGTLTSLTLSGAISGVTTLTATNLAGTLTTAAQPNITTLGQLTTLTTLALNVSGPSVFYQFDTNTSSIIYPVVINHFLGSGTAAIGIGSGLQFNSVNNGGLNVTYSSIGASATNVTNGSHAGALIFNNVFNGAFVNSAMTLTPTTASTSTLNVNGQITTTTVTATNLAGTLSTVAQPNITSLGTLTALTISGLLTLSSLNVSGTTTLTSLSASGLVTFTNTSTSITPASNSVALSGGCYIAKNLLYNQYISPNNQMIGSSHLASTNAISLYDNAIYFRNQNGGDANHGLMYSGNGNVNWNSSKGFGNPTTATDGPVLYGNAGVVIGNLNSSATETICATFVNTTTNLVTANVTSKLNINSPPATGAQVNIASVGTAMNIYYSSSVYTSFTCDSLANTYLTCTNTGTSNTAQFTFSDLGYVSLFSRATTFGTPRYVLDFGNTYQDFMINLYTTGSGGSGGFGCNSAGMNYLSQSSTAAHTFYQSTSAGNLTNVLATISTSGLTMAANSQIKVIANGTVIDGISMTDSVLSLNHFYINTISTLTNLYNTNTANDILFSIGSRGSENVRIRQNSFCIGNSAGIYPLDILSVYSFNLTGGYYYLSGGGTGSGSGTGSTSWSASFSARLKCSEVDCPSDSRIKENIREITEDEASQMFSIEPIWYKLINKDEYSYGYRAQDIAKKDNLHDLIQLHNDESITEEYLDEDNFKVDKGILLTVNYSKIIPVLHKYIQMQDITIKRNEDTIEDLNRRLIKLTNAFYDLEYKLS